MGNAEFARYLSVSYLAGSLYKWPPLHYARCHSREGGDGMNPNGVGCRWYNQMMHSYWWNGCERAHTALTM